MVRAGGGTCFRWGRGEEYVHGNLEESDLNFGSKMRGRAKGYFLAMKLAVRLCSRVEIISFGGRLRLGRFGPMIWDDLSTL